MNLAYKTALMFTTKYGASVITNGTFAANVTGWSAVNTPTTFEWSAGRAHVIADQTGDGMGQFVDLDLGARYVLEFDYEVIAGQLNVGKTGMTTISGLTGSGHYRHVFTETDGANRNMLFQTQQVAPGEFYLDNITLRRIF